MLLKVLSFILACSLPQGIFATKISGSDDEHAGAWNFTNTDKIRRLLLPGYDRWVRPGEINEATPVKFSLTVTHFYIDEAKSVATLVGWMKVVWHDKKLRWNATDYDNVNIVRVAPDEIWRPDLELYNVAFKAPLVGTHANALVYSDGTVLWVPPVKFDVLCKLNLKAWPRDSQTCRFVFGSWTYHTEIMDLVFDKDGFEKIEESWDHGVVGRWKIKEIQTERFVKFYNCCAEPYASLQYDITVERQGSAHTIINEAPIVALIVLLLASSLMDPGSRGLLLFAVALISSIFLVSLTQQFPNYGSTPPRISILYCGLMIVSAVWGVTSAVALRLSTSETKGVPGPLRRFVKKSKLNITNEEDGVAMSPEGDKDTVTPESLKDSWTDLAKLFDRVFLAVGGLGLALLIVLSF